MKQIRISAKNLGQLALHDFCPRCFWIKLHMGFKLPYQIFPGIFSSIDSYSKKVTNFFYKKNSSLLDWFKGYDLSNPIKTPSLRDFYTIDSSTNIKLTGIPDEMFVRNDGSYFITDYKTAKYTENQDSLLPMYKVQLNGYAYIAERIGYKSVTGLCLLYYEPFTDIQIKDINEIASNEGFSMLFSAHTVDIELNQRIIPELLQKTREIYDLHEAPDKNENCKDCQIIEKISFFTI